MTETTAHHLNRITAVVRLKDRQDKYIAAFDRGENDGSRLVYFARKLRTEKYDAYASAGWLIRNVTGQTGPAPQTIADCQAVAKLAYEIAR